MKHWTRRWARLARTAGQQLAEATHVYATTGRALSKADAERSRMIVQTGFAYLYSASVNIHQLTRDARWWARWFPWL